LSDSSPDLAASAPVAKSKPEPKKTDWWTELKGIIWLVLGVLAVWSFIAKPFYIPSESMMPTLIKGDRLIVTKYPYGWSYVSPSFHVLPFMKGRIFGRMPQRGDVVILKPPTENSDYIKRVIGLPGDTIEVNRGILSLNGKPVKRVSMGVKMLPIDDNVPCSSPLESATRKTGPDGKDYCELPIFRETLPNGVSYDTVDFGYQPGTGDDYGPITIPAEHVFVMGDNRDESADSRYETWQLGLGGPVAWENLGGRADFITFSYDGSTKIWNPLTWLTALRGGRAGINLHPSHDTTAAGK
jgi:signal peptidase I